MKPFLRRTLAVEVIWTVLAVFCAHAQNTEPDLTSLKIEDLMNLDVTSASKKAEKISRVPSAIFVITPEDIQRSGATNIPDVLRMVPGLEVAQITPSTWAITARGFNGAYANKLLVLIDGLAVYTPIYSGVYWDAQDVSLDTVERIEVIRGPGATVWGTNAVNGVISIITKPAEATQGANVSARGGTLEHGGGAVGYGGHIGGHGAYRLFAHGWVVAPYVAPGGQNGKDDWNGFDGGFRTDMNFSKRDLLTVQGETVRGNEGEIVALPVSLEPPVNAIRDLRSRFSGWHVSGWWQHTMSSNSEASLQVYFDHSNRGDSSYSTGLSTFDVDFHEHLPWRRRHDLVWGAGYRLYSDGTTSFFRLSLSVPALNSQIFNGFLQDEIAIRPDRLYVTLGAKLAHEYYNGFNFQPTARITFAPSDGAMLWAAISGARRTPSRIETAIRFNRAVYPGPNNLATLLSLFGNPDQKNERLTATEAGFRKDLSGRLSFDATAFYNRYRDLRSDDQGPPRLEAEPPPLHLLIPITFGNHLYGETHGIELFANVKLASRWTVSPAYSFLAMHLHSEVGSGDLSTVPGTEGSLPNQQAQLRSNVNLPWHWQWTTSAYFVGRLKAPGIPSYTRLDTNLAWQASERISVGLGGQNLVKNLHPEFAGPDLTINPSLVRRSAYAWLAWRF